MFGQPIGIKQGQLGGVDEVKEIYALRADFPNLNEPMKVGALNNWSKSRLKALFTDSHEPKEPAILITVRNKWQTLSEDLNYDDLTSSLDDEDDGYNILKLSDVANVELRPTFLLGAFLPASAIQFLDEGDIFQPLNMYDFQNELKARNAMFDEGVVAIKPTKDWMAKPDAGYFLTAKRLGALPQDVRRALLSPPEA